MVQGNSDEAVESSHQVFVTSRALALCSNCKGQLICYAHAESEQKRAARHSLGVCQAAVGAGPRRPHRGALLHRLSSYQGTSVQFSEGMTLPQPVNAVCSLLLI